MITELVAYFIKTIAYHPEKVVVSEGKTAEKRVITIAVAQEDRGRVIGKDGKTIRAIRHCAEAVFPEAQDILIDLAPQKDN